jgi:membrane fusion protein, multidrug efflux system
MRHPTANGDRTMPIAMVPQWRARLTLLVASTLLLGGCGGDQPPPEPVVRPVRYTQVFASGGERLRVFSGTARAAVESRLSFKVGGTVTRVAVAVGDRVEAGQLIAEIDDRDLRLQEEEAQARLNSARAQARNRSASFSRMRALYENRNASRNDLDAARAADVSARESVNSVAKSLELLKAQLEYTRLVARTDGAIATVATEPNENVAAGQVVAVMTSGERLEVVVSVPQVLIAQVREGDGVEVAFDGLPERPFAARVTEVGVPLSGTASTFPVTVQLDHADPNCRPGMAAEVGFHSGSQGPDAIVVASVAVSEDRQGRFVFVLQPAEEGFGAVHRRAVEVGEMSAGHLEISGGLSDGEYVVTAGVTRIVDGQKVRMLGAE